MTKNRMRGTRGGKKQGRNPTSGRGAPASKNTDTKKKTLGDYFYNTGSAKNTSEYVSTTKFLLNHISITLEDGADVVEALRTGTEFNFDPVAPSIP